MPIKKTAGGYQCGDHGTKYKKREDAVKQMQAALANGYVEDNKKKKSSNKKRKTDK